MIKIKKHNEVHCFANRDAFGWWLVENGYVRRIHEFTNDKYSAWDILQYNYSYNDIKAKWWDSEVLGAIQQWLDCGQAKEVV